MELLESIPHSLLNFHNKLVKDYISGKEDMKPFYVNEPNIKGVLKTAEQRVFSEENRNILTQALNDQYKALNMGAIVRTNIEKLKEENTFTVTTGHQLCVYTGPAYFIYKIASVINLATQLNKEDNSKNFVPVFWMASEDHDFEEISEVNFTGKKWKWEKENDSFGNVPVGVLDPAGTALWASEMKQYFRDEANVSSVISCFENAYKNNRNLSDATREAVHELFKEYGLVIIDGNDSQLKNSFKPELIKEITESNSFASLNRTTSALKQLGYEGQITGREINLFYFDESNQRKRIERSGDKYSINNSEKKFDLTEIINEINDHPGKFSPNVVLRPVYQEAILPNIAYIGGPAEVAYWLQLKEVFSNFGVQFPVPLVRSSYAIVPDKYEEKISKYGFTSMDFFTLNADQIIQQFIQKNNSEELNFDAEKKLMEELVSTLNSKAALVDKQLPTAISAEANNMHESLEKIQSKFNKSVKQKSDSDIKGIIKMKNVLFPDNAAQERVLNFMSCFYFNENPLEKLINWSNPFDYQLKLLKK